MTEKMSPVFFLLSSYSDFLHFTATFLAECTGLPYKMDSEYVNASGFTYWALVFESLGFNCC